MKNGTPILDEILYRDLRPWIEENETDEKYFALNAKLKELVPAFHLRFSIDFPRPFNNKTKYYFKLISNAAATYSAQLIAHIHGDEDESVILYLLNNILEKKLKNSLRDLGRILKEEDFTMTYLGKNYIPAPEEINHKSDTYIMQLLKLAYMKVFLEVQEEFRQYRDDILIPADFYSQLLNEPVPDHIPVSKNLTVEVEAVPVNEVKKAKPSATVSSNSFAFLDYDKAQDKLADAFDRLKNKEFIHKETTLPAFKKIFSGREITAPVRWVGNASDLYYFIKLIYSVNKLVKDLKQKQWDVACKCFVDEDGNAFEKDKIRLLKKPATTAEQLEFIVSMLK